jgi:hypothetical protein
MYVIQRIEILAVHGRVTEAMTDPNRVREELTAAHFPYRADVALMGVGQADSIAARPSVPCLKCAAEGRLEIPAIGRILVYVKWPGIFISTC